MKPGTLYSGEGLISPPTLHSLKSHLPLWTQSGHAAEGGLRLKGSDYFLSQWQFTSLGKLAGFTSTTLLFGSEMSSSWVFSYWNDGKWTRGEGDKIKSMTLGAVAGFENLFVLGSFGTLGLVILMCQASVSSAVTWEEHNNYTQRSQGCWEELKEVNPCENVWRRLKQC